MSATTNRQRGLGKALDRLLPYAPLADTQQIRAIAAERRMRELPPTIAIWLATVAHVRHAHTEYDALLDEGYDRDAARFFVVDQINDVLTTWRATRLLEPGEEDEDSL